ncbi:Translation factor pelota [Ceratocystis pirilliformis]|uniref:Translation factor pelota n=1 Tax=Ceratocystis pirilliformis TaxID=259994 RepID=A0ABR3YXY6_9PEZI
MKIVGADEVQKQSAKDKRENKAKRSNDLPKLNFEEVNDGQRLSVLPEDMEDLWYLSAIIRAKDMLRCQTTRNVVTKPGRPAERITLWLVIEVISSEYLESDTELTVKGTIVNENKYVSLGRHHTLHVKLGSPCSLWKPNPGFDAMDIRFLRAACNEDRPEHVRAVVMQDNLAYVCIVTPNRVIVRSRLGRNQRSRHTLSSKKSTRMFEAFFNSVLKALATAFPQIDQEPIVIASPSFAGEDFRKYCTTIARDDPTRYPGLGTACRKMVLATAPSGTVNGLRQVLQNGSLAKTLSGSISTQIKLLEDYLRANDLRAVYGNSLVHKAAEMGALCKGATLFVSNSHFFESNHQKRIEINDLTESVRLMGGNVIFTPVSEADVIRLLGGIAAIASFPLYDLDEEVDGAVEGYQPPALGEGFLERPWEDLVV